MEDNGVRSVNEKSARHTHVPPTKKRYGCWWWGFLLALAGLTEESNIALVIDAFVCWTTTLPIIYTKTIEDTNSKVLSRVSLC